MVDVSDSETRKYRAHVSECVTKKAGSVDSVRISEINFLFYPIYRLSSVTVMQQLNLVSVFEKYEIIT